MWDLLLCICSKNPDKCIWAQAQCNYWVVQCFLQRWNWLLGWCGFWSQQHTPFCCGICRRSMQDLLRRKYRQKWGGYCPGLDWSKATPMHCQICCAVFEGLKRLCELKALKGVNVTMRKQKTSWHRNHLNNKWEGIWISVSYLRLFGFMWIFF